jgi:hypothetical protein
MADRTVVAVNFGACHQAVLIDLDGWSLDEFAINALVQRNVGEQPLLGQRRIVHGDRHAAKLKPRQHDSGYENHSE